MYLRKSVLFMCLLVFPVSLMAQDPGSIAKLEDEIRQLETVAEKAGNSAEVASVNTGFLATRRTRLYTLLESRISNLRRYRVAADTILASKEKELVDLEIKRLNDKLDGLRSYVPAEDRMFIPSNDSEINNIRSQERAIAAPEPQPVSMNEASLPLDVSSSPAQPNGPRFLLSHPDSGRTDLSTGDFKLSWTRAPWAKSFTVEVREDKAFGTGGEIIKATVTGQTNFTIPKDKLKAGEKYYWQVTAECDSAVTNCAGMTTIMAANAPYAFTTISQLGFFNYLSKRGFSLQRVVAGDDESEGANFSFLRTIGEKTVYATDFAFIWNSREAGAGNTRYALETSVEGHLTSDESEAEDALRFGLGANIVNRFGSTGLTGLHSTLSAKFESDQRFTTKKMYFEALETLTAIKYFMGRFSGDNASPLQFRWRPFFAFQAGHTFKQGEASLPEDTVLRLIPRARLELKLNFISQALKIPKTLLFVDNTFYYLPLEERMRTTNFLASGLEFDFTPNFGLSFNYKNGKAAPKFEHVHTFGGAFTVRFGKNEK